MGITEKDVAASTSIFQLLNWQIEVSKDIANISGQMEMASAEYHLSGESTEPKKYARQKHAKRLLELFCQRINVRVQELKFEPTLKRRQFAETFVEVALLNLDNEVYQDLVYETTQKLNK